VFLTTNPNEQPRLNRACGPYFNDPLFLAVSNLGLDFFELQKEVQIPKLSQINSAAMGIRFVGVEHIVTAVVMRPLVVGT